MDTETAPTAALRFMSGARERDSGIYFDETRTLTGSTTTLPEAKSPPGDWLRDFLIYFDVVTAGNSATVTWDADAPFNLIDRLRFKDATGTTLHEVTGYELFLDNLLNGRLHQSDPRLAPDYTLTAGGDATSGSSTFVLQVPIEIVPRDAIGVLPNGASNSVTRVEIVLADKDAAYGTSPTAAPSVRTRIIERGYVQPVANSVTGMAFNNTPPGAPFIFQQIGVNPYDVKVGRRVEQHVRKGNVLRSLIFVARTDAGVRSDTLIDEMRVRIDKVETVDGPWRHLRHVTWSRQNILAANLPAGVIQVSFAHEWDGKVGGELRDLYVSTAPGSLVEFDYVGTAAGTLSVITNEIVAPAELGLVL